MRVLIINTDYRIGGSVGRIAYEIAENFTNQGDEVAFAYGRECKFEGEKIQIYKIGNLAEVYLHGLYTRLTDKCGFGSIFGTKKFIKWANEFNPDLVWLHNIHGYYINIELLFNWIKSRPQMRVKWTLHDCWSFTGHCTYFSFIKCSKWKKGCEHCLQINRYPKAFVDSSKWNFEKKKSLFTNVGNMELIVPSQWLANLVKESFLKEYPILVVHNKINTDIFKPRPSTFRKNFGLEKKVIILGVANVWEERKGLFDFYKLSNILDDYFIIVLIGLNNSQKEKLPRNIMALDKTNSMEKLAEIYTAADVLFNPTYEDNYPTINLEAQACGTPVVTYKTGGSPESVPSSHVFEQGDIVAVARYIKNLVSHNFK